MTPAMGRLRRRPAPIVCCVGSTDPTAAAGLFADARHLARLRVRPAFVVAGVTAQNSARVFRVDALPARAILAQLRAIWAQVRPDAVRIGLLPDAASIDAVARFFAGRRDRPPIVVDPVLAASSGRTFLDARAIAALRRLLRYATIATPNRREASILTGTRVAGVDGAERAALALARDGIAALVTGGDASGARIVDVLAVRDRAIRLSAPRIGRGMRGTGCCMSAALAAALARGDDVERAVLFARGYVRRIIASASPLGRGKAQPA
ncbi:MAG TPA: hydroxymethylpyrimidine/phosphomethylpyrimidine kinase [Candidatus Eremiobacteraceae bacterium]|nr:hydroxymethylpyrimidine/phosphomethylpyrimidine kinase [Candidatus Eremiobacteraceae bacterium]